MKSKKNIFGVENVLGAADDCFIVMSDRICMSCWYEGKVKVRHMPEMPALWTYSQLVASFYSELTNKYFVSSDTSYPSSVVVELWKQRKPWRKLKSVKMKQRFSPSTCRIKSFFTTLITKMLSDVCGRSKAATFGFMWLSSFVFVC